MSLLTDLQAAVASVEVDAALFHSITQGDDTTIVTTENGPVWSLAKSVKYIKDTGDTALSDFDAAQSSALVTFGEDSGTALTQFGTDSAAAITTFNDAGASAITTFNDNAGVALANLQTAIDDIVAGTDVALKSFENTFSQLNHFDGGIMLPTAPEGNSSINGANTEFVMRAITTFSTTDLRLGVIGGVSMASGSYAYAGTAPALNGQVTKLWHGLPTAGTFCNVLATGSVRCGLAIVSGALRLIVNGAAVGTSMAVPTTPQWYAVTCTSAGVWSAYINSDFSTAAATNTNASYLPTADACDGLGTAYSGTNYEAKIYNTVATSAQMKACAKGEIPAELALRGYAAITDASPISDGTGWANPPYTKSWSGGVLSFTSQQYQGVSLRLSAPAKAGATILVSGNNTSASALTLYQLNGTVPTADAIYAPTGVFSIEVVAGGAVDGIGFRFEGGGSGLSASISGLHAEVIGTVEAFEPEQVWNIGVWEGKFGSYLLPVSGLVALNPQPLKDRFRRFRCDLAGTVSASAAGPLFTVADLGSGVLQLTPNALIAASIPTATGNSESSGHVVQSVSNTSTGVVTLTNRNGGTATDAVIVGTVSFTA